MKTTMTALAVMVLLSVPLQGQEGEFLKGIEGFKMDVHLVTDPDVNLFSKHTIRTWAELVLRRNGIRVGAAEIAEIRVNVAVISIDVEEPRRTFRERGYVYSIRTEVRDLVTASTSDWLGFATVWWHAGAIGICEEPDLVALVKQNVEQGIESLANDYLTANPPN